MKNITFIILLFAAFALSSCSSATNETIISNNEKIGNAKAGAGNNVVKKTNSNKPPEVAKNANANSEEKKSTELAKCELTKFPSVKGFSLGQTVDEINVKYPFFKQGYEAELTKQTPDQQKANFVLMTLGSSFNDAETKNVENFNEVNLIWHFLDDKLMALVVNYQDDETYKIEKIKQLVEKIAKEYNLPKDGWKFDAEDGATLNCQGFRVDVSNNYQSGPSLMITDSNLEKEMEKRGV